MGNYGEQRTKFSHDEVPLKRWYSDSILTLVTGCLSCVTCLLSAAACYRGNLKQLAPYDLNADFCGSKIVGEERQYLYYPDPYNPINGICVESCPTDDWTGTINIPDGLGGITVHPVSSSELVSGQYCFQRRMKSRDILTTLQQKRPFLYSFVQDVFKATEVLFATVFISIVIAIVGMKAMLNKKAGRNVSLAASFAPCFFAMAIALLTLYHFFTPRVLAPGISLLLLASVLVSTTIMTLLLVACPHVICIQAISSFCTGAIPVIFPKTYARSRQLLLVGAQALEEMPDMLTFVIMTSVGIGATLLWNIWICASLLTMGRAVPEALIVESHADTYMGIMTSFTRTPGQGLACIIVLVTFVLQFESAIVFTKFLTTRCVKKWFEKLPRNGVRNPRCDYLIPVCTDVPKDWGPLGAATFFAPICRIPATFMQMLAAETAIEPHGDTLATYLQRRLAYLNDCLLFNNQLLPTKMDEASCGFLESALAGYLELTQGKVDDHYSARRYSVQELLSPAFQVGFFSTMSLFVAMVTWIALEIAPIFNHTGQKSLDSIPMVVMVAFVMSSLVLAVFREAVNAAACAVVMLWSKAASDVLWCNAINSDTLPVYESKHLRKFLELLRRKCDRQILF